MSSQPSTGEKIKQSANSAIESVSSTASATDPNYDPNKDKNNFAKDDHGNTFKKGDYKDQLNQAAHGNLNGEPEKKEESYLEKGGSSNHMHSLKGRRGSWRKSKLMIKVASYIPGISSLQQKAFDQGPEEDTTTTNKPPPGPSVNRPDHDVQVEEFLRKQYQSKSDHGMPDPDAKE
jgi:hypothetical protein